MQLQVLGPLRVTTAGGLQEPAGSLQRQLLGLLAAASARPVAADLLMDSLWGPAPDEQRPGRLQVHIHRLRKLLGDPERLTHGPLGYTLEVSVEEVDARTFEVQVERALAHSDVQESIRALEGALAPWVGEAYEGIADPLVETEARRLSDRRLDAVDALATRYLAAGRVEAAAELVAAPLREHPWREGFAVSRMAALARLGRQREALEVYRSVRAALVEELGIEPGQALQDAQAAVLAGEQVDLVRAETAAVPIPSQLPLSPPLLAGRADELAQLDVALAAGTAHRGTRVAVVSGTAGVGKSALALTWARTHEREFPDGVLHLDLRGWSTDRPVSVEVALGRILRSFGVQAPTGEVHEQAATLRSLMRDRSVLLVLDNAASEDQVRPLLPSAPGCAVLVTSRDRLPGLAVHEGAVPIELEPLDDEQARELLVGVLGPDLGADPAALTQLARRCAHLPLALCVAAEYVRSRPALGLDGLLEELADDGARLDVLDQDAGAGVRSVFGRSYDQLEEGAAAAFRLFGVLPIAHLDLPALAAMMGVQVRAARSALSALMRAHLVFERPGRPGFPRYGTHDLLAAFGAELAEKVDGEAAQNAVDRLFDHYATGAVRAVQVLEPPAEAARASDVDRVEMAASASVAGPHLPDAEAASRWLVTELASLVGAAAAASPAVDQRLCATAGVLHAHLHASGTGGRRLGRDLQQRAIAAAERLGDTRELSDRYNSVTLYEADLWQLDRAREHMAAAVEVMGENASDYVRARALHNQAILLIWQARYREALALTRQALSYYRRRAAEVDSENQLAHADATPEPWREDVHGGIAVALNTQGMTLLELRRFDEADAALTEAGEMAKTFALSMVAALVVHNRGVVARRAGRLDEALSLAQQMLAAVEADGLGAFAGQAWNLLGAVHTARGQARLAVPLHRTALRSARSSSDHSLEAESMVWLAEALEATGDRNGSLTAFRQGVSLADNPAATAEHVRALTGLARIYSAIGLPSAARPCLEQAIRLCEPTDLDASPLKKALADLP